VDLRRDAATEKETDMAVLNDDNIIGYRKDGRVIRRYAGGSEGAPEGESSDDDGGEGGDTDVERLQRAIDNERTQTKQARDALRP
jgi:hypothetical protein